MATTATLFAVPITGAKTNHISTSLENTKRKNQENLSSTRKMPPVHSVHSSPPQSSMMSVDEIQPDHGEIKVNGGPKPNLSRFRIPKIEKVKNQGSPTEQNSSSSSLPTSQVNGNASSNDQSNMETQGQPGKRKLSVSQYKEHKRLKSSEPIQNSSGDVDMRIPIQDSSSIKIKEQPSITVNSAQPISTKQIDSNKNVIKKSNLTEPGVKKTMKRKLIWADDKNQPLEHISFFEVDESERSHMHLVAPQSLAHPMSIAQLEKLHERDLRRRQNQPPLPPLTRILLPSTMANPTVKSHQRVVQEERERTVLQALFIGSLLPDSPSEPDCDSPEDSTIETKLIPLEDNSSTHESKEVSPTNSPPPSSTETVATMIPSVPSSIVDMSPVAQILAAARENLSSVKTNNYVAPNVPTSNPNLLFTPTPNFLSMFLNGTPNLNLPPMNPLANLLPSLSLPFNPTSIQTLSSLGQMLANSFSLPTSSNQIPQPTLVLPTFNTSVLSVPTAADSPSNNFESMKNHPPSRFNNQNNHQQSGPHRRKHFHRRGQGNMHRRQFHSNRNGSS